MTRENWGRRLEILRRLARGETRGGGSPSVREVGVAVGLSSKQTAHKHLKKLEEHGYVERGEGWVRAVRLTRKGWEAVGAAPLLQSEGYEDALVPADEVRVQGRVVQVVHPPRRP
jgi:SOS-response transcriptional repressor LexA